MNDSSAQIIPKKRKHTLPLSAICSFFIYIKANHSQMIPLQSIITSQIVFSHYYSKHTVICSDRAICYCSAPINLARGDIRLQKQIGEILYTICIDVLISCGKINFAMIAYIWICMYLVQVIYFYRFPYGPLSAKHAMFLLWVSLCVVCFSESCSVNVIGSRVCHESVLLSQGHRS